MNFQTMRLLIPLSIMYLLIVTAYMVSARDPLQKSVKQEYIDSLMERVEQLQTEIDSRIVSNKCPVASKESSDDECLLSTEQIKEFKTAALAEQPVYPLKSGILNTTLSICNPRSGSCL